MKQQQVEVVSAGAAEGALHAAGKHDMEQQADNALTTACDCNSR
jgi:hypothetical protein